MCQKNVGRIDAFLRISLGFLTFGIGIMKKRPSLTTIGAVKIASGTSRYCPVYDLLDLTTVSDEEILEELGFEYDDFEEEDDEGDIVIEKVYDISDDDLPLDGRRHYTHRSIRRNQYMNRDLL